LTSLAQKGEDRFMRTKISCSILACFAIAVLSVPFLKPEEYVSHTKVGQDVPAFAITTLEGREFSTAGSKGKVVLLNFWATWCAPCQIEMPMLEKEIWKKYQGPDFEMIAIAREQTDKEITEFRAKHEYSFPMAPDPKRAVYGKFANAGIPRTYVINRDGKILFQSAGYTPEDFQKMKSILEKELKK
jgi:peroxiredoxin